MSPMTEYEMQNLLVLNRIAHALEQLAMTNAKIPDLKRPLESYRDFDYATIGATVVGHDENGATALDWGGFIWTRRSPQNKFDSAIWFSRPNGKNEDGTPHYDRLITFKTYTEAEPLPRKVEALVTTAKVKVSAVEPTKSAEDLLPAKKTTPETYCSRHLTEMTSKTSYGTPFHMTAESMMCNGASDIDPEAPDSCHIHFLRMTESTREGVIFHRTTKDGKTMYCNGATVKEAGSK